MDDTWGERQPGTRISDRYAKRRVGRRVTGYIQTMFRKSIITRTPHNNPAACERFEYESTRIPQIQSQASSFEITPA
jgi:hypothetical protein